ncbi:MAG: hypothetical protein A2145_02500 [candidate division Zixibacteria bacterium RBG_16_40_9]|nr:MAG: hypothetical protein A2145_02500 [candidate division Zixibacteria bacterium RBG_16_40_9]
MAELDLKTPFKEEIENLNSLFTSHQTFGLRALQELKRAERYSEFVSLILIDLEKGLGVLSKKQKQAFLAYDWEKDVYDLVKKEVRQTDVISGFENKKMALLLTETSQDGAKALAKRLSEEILLHLAAERKKLLDPRTLMKIVSFPDKEKGKEKFLSVVETLRANRFTLSRRDK